MGYKSFLPTINNMLDDANLETAENIAEFVRKKAYERAPVQGGKSADGRYISKSRKPKKRAPGTYRKQIKASYDDERVVVGVNDILGLWLEEGTSRRFGGYSPAFPHFQPAFEENTREIKQIVKDAYRNNVD